MTHQIWHAFYYDRTAATAPCRSEVIEADSEEAAARIARDHLAGCERVSLEGAPWLQRRGRVIYAAEREPPSTLH
jgi:hypothetical protein